MTNSRIAALQAFLGENDAALVTSHENRFYLTGFKSSAGSLLVTKKRAVLLVDFRYIEKAKNSVPFCEVILAERGGIGVKELLADGDYRILVETERMSAAEWRKKSEELCGLSDCDELDNYLNTARAIKSEDELEAIRKAQKLTDDTFTYILTKIKAGKTEKEIMLDMEFYMRSLGSEGVSFDFIVVSGKNSSLPHGVPTDKVVENGDFITMDFGAVVDGYRSDMTRTVAVGFVTDEMRRVYETVRAAQFAAFEKIKAGAVCRDVDAASRDLIYGAGYEGCFGHGLGHSVGCEIHESPAFNPTCETKLAVGMVMTVEPGIYLENKFGVRIEDMVFVTEDGFEKITKSSSELIIL